MEKKTLLFCLGFLASTSALAAPSHTYEITDLLCESGSPVNEKESIPKGRVLNWPGNFAAATEDIRRQQSLPSFVIKNLVKDPSKLVLYVSTIGSGLEYQSGQGPCPEGDDFVILGRQIQPVLLSGAKE